MRRDRQKKRFPPLYFSNACVFMVSYTMRTKAEPGEEAHMVARRTSPWINWIAIAGYVGLCGLLWAALN